MKTLAVKTDRMIEPLRRFAGQFASPVIDLAIRLYMAGIFFKSGWLKFQSFLNGDWASTVFLFREAHPLPGIPAEIAAIMGTGGEIVFSVLLALGLFARLGAAGLLAMTFAIQFLVPEDYGILSPVHYLWMLLLAVPFIKGPGPLSVDRFLLKWLRK